MNVSDYKNYLISDAEPDRCRKTWDRLYTPFIQKGIASGRITGRYFIGNSGEKRYMSYFRETSDGDIDVKLSGDTFFNFNIGKKGKFKQFEKLLTNENEIKQLNRCNKLTHSLPNFVLMPCTGAMQLYKQNCGGNLDRPDVFLFMLKDYYVGNRDLDHVIFSRARGNKSKDHTAEENIQKQKKRLKLFLDSFDGIHAYCRELCFLDDSTLVDKLIEHGAREIKDATDVISYMNLAEEYWEYRRGLLSN